MLFEQLQADNQKAMRERDEATRNILGIVLSKVKLIEIAKRDKKEQLTDADVVAVMQKTVKELTEESENYAKAKNLVMQKTIDAQKTIVERYMPKMLSEAEVAAIIGKQTDKSIPNIMKLFKAEYSGKCDMQMVQKVLKSLS